jgi:hypothetical protein
MQNIPGEATYIQRGYDSILRGEIPASWHGLDKTVRRVILEHETEPQSVPCQIALRIGNSQMIRDANTSSGYQAVQWNTEPELPLKSPDELTVASMTANNLRPDYTTDWHPFSSGRHLYYELRVKGAGSALAVGGKTDWSRIDFEVKPGA